MKGAHASRVTDAYPEHSTKTPAPEMACRLPSGRAHAGSFIPVTESNLGPVPLIPCEGSYVKNLRRPVIVCLVVLSLFSLDGILIGDLVFARSAPARARSQARGENVSADLRERMRGAHAGEDRVRVILQLKGKASGRLNALLQRAGRRRIQLHDDAQARIAVRRTHECAQVGRDL